MLRPEQAKAQLSEYQLSFEGNRIAEDVARLPKRLRDVAAWVYGLKREEIARHPSNWSEVDRQERQAVVQLDRLPTSDRIKVFEVVGSRLAPAMDRAWQLLKTMPYQAGFPKKAFRAPNHPEIMVEVLGSWMTCMVALARGYRAEILTPAWLATWSPHVFGSHGFAEDIGTLLAAVLNQQDTESEEVFDILLQSLNGQHEVGAPGRHVYTAFLLCERPAAWEAVERTLLAAQRQEGLRQSILETIDLTHPTAFRRMMRLILEHDLLRFSSVVRAVDVWFAQLWVAASASVIKKMLGQVVEFLETPAARMKALRGQDAEAAFLALWCAATEDAVASVGLAEELLAAESAELRYVAAVHLVNLDLDVASDALVPVLDDEDLRVALVALNGSRYVAPTTGLPRANNDGRFERVERLVDRIDTKPQNLEPLVWPWTARTVEQSDVATWLLFALGEQPATKLIPHLSKLNPGVRAQAVTKLVESKTWDEATRTAVVELAGDRSAEVRAVAIQGLMEQPLTPQEIARLECYLTRKSSNIRRGVLALLLKRDDRDVLESSGRLLAATNANQRLAGLELLRKMTDASRSVQECRNHAATYRAGRKKFNQLEQAHLDAITAERTAPATLDDALGLMNPADRSSVIAPRKRKVRFITPAAVGCLRSLDDLVHEHREMPLQYDAYGCMREELLGTVPWGFPSPDYDKPREGQEERLPLCQTWKKWYAERKQALRDKDGLELVRSLIWAEFCNDWQAQHWSQWAESSPERREVAKILSGNQPQCTLRYPYLVRELIQWLLFLFPCDARAYLLDAQETAYALVPPDDLAQARKPLNPQGAVRGPLALFLNESHADWRFEHQLAMWSDAISLLALITGYELAPEHVTRLWQLMHWRDEPVPGARRLRPNPNLLRAAYSGGAANLADVADQLFNAGPDVHYDFERFSLLNEVTERKPDKEVEAWLNEHPEVQDLVSRAVGRILDLELSRGDAATPATAPAHALRSLSGVETLHRILHALGKSEFKLGHRWRTMEVEDRQQTLTHLARISFPGDEETPDDFIRIMKSAIREGHFPEERLLQLTFLAPQWTGFVEAYFGWPQMREGVYWFLAHMRSVGGLGELAAEATLAGEPGGEDDLSAGSSAMEAANGGNELSAWDRLILQRTPLSDADRNEGAVDVPWFQRIYAQLKDRRWQRLATAARFAANASQARRAAFIADVLLNRVPRKVLVDGIKKRQLKEHVRLLGLLPLAKGKRHKADLMERCRILREYRRYANKLSGLTKPAALRAWEIGMRNLAQTAGYSDPLRLEWAVSAEESKHLADGPMVVEKDGVTVGLVLDEVSRPVVTVRRGERQLKSIPPAVKKDKRVTELTGRVNELKRQASSIRQSLEAAMCRGDVFQGEELRQWCCHALLAPLIARLIVIGEGIIGYPDKAGQALRDYAGKLEPIKAKEALRIAHPHDLLETGQWHEWQRECFRAERVQPFKQVFRELYIVTAQEKRDGGVSSRYDGQQIQPTQALALFGNRGWNTQDGVFKVFHDLQLTANVHFDGGFGTPLEVEGATLSGVSFTNWDEWEPIPIAEVPPRLFSEVMRDVDLVVSVAHAGGVDPEASASTIEMRAGLLRETCALLNLANVRLESTHALIDGALANYSVHLGSGTVHKFPGGALCIVPVHAQHRGRLFLPFADDDPRTAEVISKVLLLARDDTIQDPTILEQIYR